MTCGGAALPRAARLGKGLDVIEPTPPLLFGACAASGLINPIPEDVVLLAAGAWLATRPIDAAPVVLACALGVFLRDVLAFLAGRALQRSRLGQSAWFESVRRAEHASEWQTLVTARLAAGFRVPLFVAAGAFGLSWRRFLAVDLIGVAVTTPATLGLGAALGEATAGMPAIRAVGAVVLIALAARLWLRVREQVSV